MSNIALKNIKIVIMIMYQIWNVKTGGASAVEASDRGADEPSVLVELNMAAPEPTYPIGNLPEQTRIEYLKKNIVTM